MIDTDEHATVPPLLSVKVIRPVATPMLREPATSGNSVRSKLAEVPGL
jgi:hypothetical protein